MTAFQKGIKIKQERAHLKIKSQSNEANEEEDEGVRVLANGGWFTETSFGLVWFLQHLGSSSRRLL